MAKDKPDNVADNPGLLPYASNVGAPVIKPDDVDTWKNQKVVKTNHYFETRYNEIKEEYKKLIESYEWNKLVYESNFKFEPIKGETYYLYQRDVGLFLSLIEPEQWNQIFIGAFKLDSNDKWEKV
tara:strand:+ start:528 stop:902 length:375 start_codon:yes stop_codon:yes gene_type:complete